MADTCIFTGDETEHEIYAKFFHCMRCDTFGRKSFTIAMCAFFLIIIITMIILYIDFIKKNQKSKPSMYNITLFYVPFTLLFYMTNILQSMNHCYMQIGVIQWITWNLKAIGYSAGFQIFINMLYYRLWFIFKATASPLSKCNIRFFIAFNIFGFLDLLLILLNDGLALDMQLLSFILLLVGVICIILGTLWISSLYIYKLWKVVQQRVKFTEDFRRRLDFHNDKLIRVLAKQTILTMLCLFGTILTLSMSAFNFFIPENHDDYFWIKRTNAIFLVVDITTNVLLFILGYKYVDKLYNKIFGCCDIRCRKCCAFLVMCSLGKHHHKPIAKKTHETVQSHTMDFTEETDTLKVSANGTKLTIHQNRSHAYAYDAPQPESSARLPSRSVGSSVAKSLSTVSLNDDDDDQLLGSLKKESIHLEYIRTKSSNIATVNVPSENQLRSGPAMKLIQEDHAHTNTKKITIDENTSDDDDYDDYDDECVDLPPIPTKGFADLPSLPRGSLSALPSIPKHGSMPGISPSRGIFPSIPKSMTELPSIPPDRLTTLPSIPSVLTPPNTRRYMHTSIAESDSCGSQSEDDEEKLPVLFIKGKDTKQDNEYSTLVQHQESEDLDKTKNVFTYRARKFVKKRRFPTLTSTRSDTSRTASDMVDIDAVIGSLTTTNVDFMKENYV